MKRLIVGPAEVMFVAVFSVGLATCDDNTIRFHRSADSLMFGVMAVALLQWWRTRRRFVALTEMTDALIRREYADQPSELKREKAELNARLREVQQPSLKRDLVSWLVLGLMFLLLLVLNTSSRQEAREQEIIFSDFLNYVDRNQVGQVTIQGSQIKLETTAGQHFETYAPHDPDLVKTLRDKGVKIAAKPAKGDPWWMVVLVLSLAVLALAVFGIFCIRQMVKTARLAAR